MSVAFAAFASGSGTNLEALLEREERGAAYRIALLVVDRECAAEGRMQRKGRITARIDFGAAGAGRGLARLLSEHGVRGILLAGFLRLVPSEVCRAFDGRILNIHPALLPAFGGKGMYGRHVHVAALASGAKISGVTVHLVNERYDEGRIIAQWPVPVLASDTPDSLAARVLEVEHLLYPAAADALARSLECGDARPPAFRWPDGFSETDGALGQAIEGAFDGGEG